MLHMRTFQPAEGVFAFYDGRVPDYRYADDANWVDDGALSLGIASYAIVDGDEALVYDAHVTLDHALAIRAGLEAIGARRFTVVLSHAHLDHVAGTAAFADCEVIANVRTAEHLEEDREAIESGTLEGAPAIRPLIQPSRVFTGELPLTVGEREVVLIQANIHSDDATVAWLPDVRILLAGDTVEDTVTYLAEPHDLAEHLVDLERLLALDPHRVLPNHGAPEVIAAGGYSADLIRATQHYVRRLQRAVVEPEVRELPLRELLAEPLGACAIHYFEPYEAVHAKNLNLLLATYSAA